MNPSDSFPKLSFVCPKLWADMTGDERTRFCDVCGLHVHNLSALTGDDRASLLRNSAGRLCVTYQRRLNGGNVTPEKPLTDRERLNVRQVGAVVLSAAALTLAAGCVTHPEVLPSPNHSTSAPITANQASTPQEEQIILQPMGIVCNVPAPAAAHQTKRQ